MYFQGLLSNYQSESSLLSEEGLFKFVAFSDTFVKREDENF